MTNADVEVPTNTSVVDLASNNGKPINGIVFRGLTFEYANSCHSSPAFNLYGSVTNVLFDSDTLTWNNGQGIGMDYPVTNVTFLNTVATHNGGPGFNSYRVKYALWQNNTATFNNWRGTQGAYYTWNSGALHIFSDHNDTITGGTTAYNQSFGIHWDTDNQNITVSSMVDSETWWQP